MDLKDEDNLRRLIDNYSYHKKCMEETFADILHTLDKQQQRAPAPTDEKAQENERIANGSSVGSLRYPCTHSNCPTPIQCGQHGCNRICIARTPEQ